MYRRDEFFQRLDYKLDNIVLLFATIGVINSTKVRNLPWKNPSHPTLKMPGYVSLDNVLCLWRCNNVPESVPEGHIGLTSETTDDLPFLWNVWIKYYVTIDLVLHHKRNHWKYIKIFSLKHIFTIRSSYSYLWYPILLRWVL